MTGATLQAFGKRDQTPSRKAFEGKRLEENRGYSETMVTRVIKPASSLRS